MKSVNSSKMHRVFDGPGNQGFPRIFILFFILTACAVVPRTQEPSKPSGSQFSENPSFCNVDADCTCGGIDKNTQNCFVGNKLYASKNVDSSRDCPDFCTGIAGHLETKCVSNECKNIPRADWNQPKACTEEAKVCPDGSAVGRTGPNCEFAPCPSDQVMCTQDVKECPDGSYVSRSGPNCEFAQCPVVVSADANAHWLCEDSSWKESPEDCFENFCIQKNDCQLMGIKGPCGSYLIAGPTKTLHKPPVFYADRCGADQCSVVTPMCVSADPESRITGFDCVDSQCIIRTPDHY